MTGIPFSKCVLGLPLAFAVVTGLSAPASAQDAATLGEQPQDDQAASELLDVPLEDLLTLESTSVAKKRQRVSDSAAAVYVITQEEIRRSAAATIPELLRGAPGVEVAHTENGGYAVSIRGFNSRLANSILVMVDGRSQFVSTLSNVFWDQLMIPMADIERIEVVRGPGAALWGANTSNGVINIITKHSADTGGTHVDLRAGDRQQEFSLTHGGSLAEALTYRAYVTVHHDNGLVDAAGTDAGRRHQGGSSGVRFDYEPDDRNAFTLQGDFDTGRYDTPFRLPSSDIFNPGYYSFQSENDFTAFNILGRWTRRASDRLSWSVQGQYNYIDRTEFGGAHLVWQLIDLDVGANWKASDTHELSLGVAARELHDRVDGTPYLYFNHPVSTERWISGYVQDDITLLPDRLRVSLGAKLEHNNFTGFEIQPSARVFLKPTRQVSLWAAVSRAIRTPSRFERDANLPMFVDLPGTAANPLPIPVYSTLVGLPSRPPEELTAYEAGGRVNLGGNWSLDVAAFFNDYSGLTVNTPVATRPLFIPNVPFPVAITADVAFLGVGKVQTWGIEASLAGNIRPWWKAGLTYSQLNYESGIDPATGQPWGLLFALEGSPRHQVSLRNNFDLGDRASIDAQLRHVSRLEQGPVPAHTDLDLRLTYRLENGAELSLVGTNLLEARHLEFVQPPYPAPPSYVPRTVSAQLRYRF